MVEWPTYTLVDRDRLVVDKRYQRELNAKRIEKIVEDFRSEIFGVILVSPRTDGTYAVIDGQHRVVAAGLLGFPSVPALVTHTESAQHEAENFVGVNTLRKKTTPFQNWTAAAFSDPSSLEAQTDQFLATLGLKVGSQGGPKTIKAVGTLKSVLDRGGLPLLRDTINLMYRHFHGLDNAYADKLIKGVATFLYIYEDKITWDKLDSAVSNELMKVGSTMTPTRILQQASVLQGVQPGLIANRFLKCYNSQNKTKHQYREARVIDGAYVGFHS